MKRFIALISAALFSVFAGVEFVLPQKDFFALNTEEHTYYYSITDEVMDAATIYRLQYGTDSRTDACETANFTPHRTTDEVKWENNRPYWFAVSRPSDDTEPVEEYVDGSPYGHSGWSEGFPSNLDIIWTYEGAEDIYICAPSEGNIRTSHYSCDYGATMEYEFTISGVTYLMSIKNAKCWYCCRNKDPNKASSGIMDMKDSTGAIRKAYQANTADSLKDREMAAGNLLVVGTTGTTVRISQVG